MKHYTPAENISILKEELNYFTKRLADSDVEGTKYINRRIRQINREIEQYSKE